MNEHEWLSAHPYLKPIAELHAAVDAVSSEISPPTIAIPKFANYAPEYRAGVPLLQSEAIDFDVEPAADLLISFANRLAASSVPCGLADECLSLWADLRREGSVDSDRLLEGSLSSARSQGLRRFLTWTVLEMYLRPVLREFANWRDEDVWLRPYCPACGSSPAMASLVGVDEGRVRYLWCGCCRTRWLYRRRGCPFCGEKDDSQLGSIVLEQENALRLDYCSNCGSYLKTCIQPRAPSVLLADWSSLHLDLLALDRGLKRSAASLYQL